MRKLKPADYLFWAVGQQTGNPIRNLILIQLCNRAGKNGTCFPSTERIAEDCGVTSRVVRTHLKALEESGHISVERRKIDGMKTSNLYGFPLVKSDRNDIPNDRNIIPHDRNEVPLPDRNEVPIKHPVLLNTQLNTHTPYSPPQSFDEFYAAYPKKTGRAAAEKAWNKLSPDASLITRILNDLKARVEQGHWCTGDGKQYIPAPSTYLNQKRWEDEIIPRPGFKKPQDFSAIAADAQDLSEGL